MAITGIETLIYGVDDVDLCVRYFKDFGLPLVKHDEKGGHFKLAEGSNVLIKPLAEVQVPGTSIVGIGVQEVILGVDSLEALKALADDLGTDRNLRHDPDGTVHFLTDCGLPLGLRLYGKKIVPTAPDPLNSIGQVHRMNRPRRWRRSAIPKTIQHVVFAVQDFQKTFTFFRERLHFRLSDFQPGYGIYSRCDGTINHHNFFFLNAALKLPGLDGQTRFHHSNFGVEDIDEIMVGANNMTRKGWAGSHLGLGRHRIDSALFYYLPCPAGGEAEYGADADYVDDAWVPRYWTSPTFGYINFTHNLPPFMMEEPKWDVRFLSDEDSPDFGANAAVI